MIAQLFIPESTLLELGENYVKKAKEKMKVIDKLAYDMVLAKAFKIEQRHKETIQRVLKPESLVCGVDIPIQPSLEDVKEWWDKYQEQLKQFNEAQKSLVFKGFKYDKEEGHYLNGDVIIDVFDEGIIMFRITEKLQHVHKTERIGNPIDNPKVYELLAAIHKHNEPFYESAKRVSARAKVDESNLIKLNWSDSRKNYILNG